MGNTEGLRRRALEHGDIPDLMALVEEAGWNQSERDWDRMLTLGTGHGLSDENGRVIASAVALPYDGRIGWIGMVLVAKPWRQRGLATELMETCVAHLAADGLLPGLDATPAGEKVYERMGFCGTMTLSRWRREARSAAGSAMPQVLPEDLGWITALDARAFGARRDGLIASLAAGCGALANRETAFLFIRPGRTATQLGPLCATDETRTPSGTRRFSSRRPDRSLDRRHDPAQNRPSRPRSGRVRARRGDSRPSPRSRRIAAAGPAPPARIEPILHGCRGGRAGGRGPHHPVRNPRSRPVRARSAPCSGRDERLDRPPPCPDCRAGRQDGTSGGRGTPRPKPRVSCGPSQPSRVAGDTD